MIDSDKKPLVGFFPGFYDMGETYPLVKIAKRYQDLGGEVVFFSHGGEYEYLAKDQGFKIIRFDVFDSITKKEQIGYFYNLDDKQLIQYVEQEALAFHNAGIEALVHPNVFFSCILSCRMAKLPLVTIISGAWTPNYYKQNRGTFPDGHENFFTLLLPKYLKNRFFNWFELNHKGPIVRKLNRVAKKIDIDLRLKNSHELSYGDHTFVCDDMEFLGLKPTKDFPAENYIGPILPEDWRTQKLNQLDFDIKKHLHRSDKSILLTMGSSFVTKKIFLEVLKVLNQTNYNVVATYTDILREDELPELNDNILLKKFVIPITELNKRVDLAIIAGGRGSVYTAAYSGKPVIGIPHIPEQQYNCDCLIRHCMAIRISKKYFLEKKFLHAIEKIFNNYEFYLKNAQSLTKKLPPPEGDKKVSEKILEIITKK